MVLSLTVELTRQPDQAAAEFRCQFSEGAGSIIAPKNGQFC